LLKGARYKDQGEREEARDKKQVSGIRCPVSGCAVILLVRVKDGPLIGSILMAGKEGVCFSRGVSV